MKGFTIPKNKYGDVCLISQHLECRDVAEIVTDIEKCVSSRPRQPFDLRTSELGSVDIVRNAGLNKRFGECKKQMLNDTASRTAIREKYAFCVLTDPKTVLEMANGKGICCGMIDTTLFKVALGDLTSGVHLFTSVDTALYHHGSACHAQLSFHLVVAKVFLCRSHQVVAQQRNSKCLMEPQPGRDHHFTIEGDDFADNLVYIYQYDNEGELVDSPHSILPVAVFNYKLKVTPFQRPTHQNVLPSKTLRKPLSKSGMTAAEIIRKKKEEALQMATESEKRRQNELEHQQVAAANREHRKRGLLNRPMNVTEQQSIITAVQHHQSMEIPMEQPEPLLSVEQSSDLIEKIQMLAGSYTNFSTDRSATTSEAAGSYTNFGTAWDAATTEAVAVDQSYDIDIEPNAVHTSGHTGSSPFLVDNIPESFFFQDMDHEYPTRESEVTESQGVQHTIECGPSETSGSVKHRGPKLVPMCVNLGWDPRFNPNESILTPGNRLALARSTVHLANNQRQLTSLRRAGRHYCQVKRNDDDSLISIAQQFPQSSLLANAFHMVIGYLRYQTGDKYLKLASGSQAKGEDVEERLLVPDSGSTIAVPVIKDTITSSCQTDDKLVSVDREIQCNMGKCSISRCVQIQCALIGERLRPIKASASTAKKESSATMAAKQRNPFRSSPWSQASERNSQTGHGMSSVSKRLPPARQTSATTQRGFIGETSTDKDKDDEQFVLGLIMSAIKLNMKTEPNDSVKQKLQNAFNAAMRKAHASGKKKDRLILDLANYAQRGLFKRCLELLEAPLDILQKCGFDTRKGMSGDSQLAGDRKDPASHLTRQVGQMWSECLMNPSNSTSGTQSRNRFQSPDIPNEGTFIGENASDRRISAYDDVFSDSLNRDIGDNPYGNSNLRNYDLRKRRASATGSGDVLDILREFNIAESRQHDQQEGDRQRQDWSFASADSDVNQQQRHYMDSPFFTSSVESSASDAFNRLGHANYPRRHRYPSGEDSLDDLSNSDRRVGGNRLPPMVGVGTLSNLDQLCNMNFQSHISKLRRKFG